MWVSPMGVELQLQSLIYSSMATAFEGGGTQNQNQNQKRKQIPGPGQNKTLSLIFLLSPLVEIKYGSKERDRTLA